MRPRPLSPVPPSFPRARPAPHAFECAVGERVVETFLADEAASTDGLHWLDGVADVRDEVELGVLFTCCVCGPRRWPQIHPVRAGSPSPLLVGVAQLDRHNRATLPRGARGSWTRSRLSANRGNGQRPRTVASDSGGGSRIRKTPASLVSVAGRPTGRAEGPHTAYPRLEESR